MAASQRDRRNTPDLALSGVAPPTEEEPLRALGAEKVFDIAGDDRLEIDIAKKPEGFRAAERGVLCPPTEEGRDERVDLVGNGAERTVARTAERRAHLSRRWIKRRKVECPIRTEPVAVDLVQADQILDDRPVTGDRHVHVHIYGNDAVDAIERLPEYAAHPRRRGRI